jgi:hypothetical protein
MNPDTNPPTNATQPPAGTAGLSAEKIYFRSGVVIFVAGLAAAALIYAFSSEQTPAPFLDPRLTEFQIERIGGKAMVYVVRFNEWFAGFWHGRPLAFTIAVLALLAALFCFWMSDRSALRARAAGNAARKD